MSMLCGGTGAEQDATPEVQALCDQVRSSVEAKTGKLDVYVAKKFTSQQVAGTNFFVKVNTGTNTSVHLRIFRPLPCNGGKPELHGVQTDKTDHDPIGYF